MSALPPIDNSLLPADVRAGSKSDQDNYKAALAFERLSNADHAPRRVVVPTELIVRGSGEVPPS